MYDAFMRTTLTFDADVAERIRQEIRSGKLSLKDVINDRLRAGFGMTPHAIRPLFRVEPHASAYQPGIDTARLNQILDDLDVECVDARPGTE
jgi:hypothetical protein